MVSILYCLFIHSYSMTYLTYGKHSALLVYPLLLYEGLHLITQSPNNTLTITEYIDHWMLSQWYTLSSFCSVNGRYCHQTAQLRIIFIMITFKKIKNIMQYFVQYLYNIYLLVSSLNPANSKHVT